MLCEQELDRPIYSTPLRKRNELSQLRREALAVDANDVSQSSMVRVEAGASTAMSQPSVVWVEPPTPRQEAGFCNNLK